MPRNTFVAVFDSEHVRFFERAPNGKLSPVQVEIASHLHHDRRDIDTDRPGRGGAANAGQRHAYESHEDVRKLEKHDFVKEVVRVLNDLHQRHEFEQLIVVAPERTIGEFRSLASEQLKRAVTHEVPKELATLSDSALEEHLTDALALK